MGFFIFWVIVWILKIVWKFLILFLSQKIVMFWNGFNLILTVSRFLVLEKWSILYLKILVNWELVAKQKKVCFFFILHIPHPPPGAPPPDPGCFWIKFTKPSGYRVSSALCSWIRPSLQLNRNFEFKKIKIAKLFKLLVNPFQNIGHLLGHHFLWLFFTLF